MQCFLCIRSSIPKATKAPAGACFSYRLPHAGEFAQYPEASTVGQFVLDLAKLKFLLAKLEANCLHLGSFPELASKCAESTAPPQDKTLGFRKGSCTKASTTRIVRSANTMSTLPRGSYVVLFGL